MTTVAGDRRAEIDTAVARFVTWMETGLAPDGLVADDCFADVNGPHWRRQVQGGEAVVASRREAQPLRSALRVEKVDRTEHGFAITFEERWDGDGQRWYCREQVTAELRDGQITDIRYYCTGDWDEAQQSAHAVEVTLIRP